MRTIIAFTLALLSTGSVLSQECRWQSDGGAFVEQVGPGEIRVTTPDGAETCPLGGAGTGVDIRIAQCESGDWAYFFVPTTLGGDDEILIFQNAAWYPACKD